MVKPMAISSELCYFVGIDSGYVVTVTYSLRSKDQSWNPMVFAHLRRQIFCRYWDLPLQLYMWRAVVWLECCVLAGKGSFPYGQITPNSMTSPWGVHIEKVSNFPKILIWNRYLNPLFTPSNKHFLKQHAMRRTAFLKFSCHLFKIYKRKKQIGDPQYLFPIHLIGLKLLQRKTIKTSL